MHYMIHVELARRLSSEKPTTGSSDAVLTSPAPRGWRRLLSKGARLESGGLPVLIDAPSGSTIRHLERGSGAQRGHRV